MQDVSFGRSLQNNRSQNAITNRILTSEDREVNYGFYAAMYQIDY